MNLNWYRALPLIAAILGVSWLVTVVCNWGDIPVALHGLIIAWFAVAISLCLLFIALVAYLGADVYEQRKRRNPRSEQQVRSAKRPFLGIGDWQWTLAHPRDWWEILQIELSTRRRLRAQARLDR